MLYRIFLLSKAAEFACMADLHQSKAGKAGERGLIVQIFPVFLHPGTLLWSICNCLWKNGRQAFALSCLCCADSTVWSGHVSNQHPALA